MVVSLVPTSRRGLESGSAIMSAIKLLRSHRASLRSMDTKSLARAISKCHGNTQVQQFGCTVASLPTAVRNNLVPVRTKKFGRNFWKVWRSSSGAPFKYWHSLNLLSQNLYMHTDAALTLFPKKTDPLCAFSSCCLVGVPEGPRRSLGNATKCQTSTKGTEWLLAQPSLPSPGGLTILGASINPLATRLSLKAPQYVLANQVPLKHWVIDKGI